MKNFLKTFGGYSLAVVGTAIFGIVAYSLFLPAMNFESMGFYVFWAAVFGAMTGFFKLASISAHERRSDKIVSEKKEAGESIWRYDVKEAKRHSLSWKIPSMIAMAMLAVFVLGCISGLRIFNVGSSCNLIGGSIEKKDVSEYWVGVEHMPKVEVVGYDDTTGGEFKDTASYLATYAFGDLGLDSTQYVLKEGNFQTIGDVNYKAYPVGHADILKWNKNKEKGCGDYILINADKKVVKETENSSVKKFAKPIIYSDSAFFGQDLDRHIRLQYPTKIFNEKFFEINDNNEAFYIVPFYTHTIGLFGGKVVEEVMILDANTGLSEVFATNNLPKWVNAIYSPERLIKYYNLNAKYMGGFWNGWFGQEGVSQLTYNSNVEGSDNNYKAYALFAVNGETYFCTGKTSVSTDESNMGFIIGNLKTGVIEAYTSKNGNNFSTAEEYSVMKSFQEDEPVKAYGYVAGFPMVVNVEGKLTYVSTLKSHAGATKAYSFMELANVNNVITNSNFDTAYDKYVDKQIEKIGVLEEIRTANIDGTTLYYLYIDGQVYSVSVKDNENVVLKNVGDLVTLNIAKSESDSIIPAKLK